MSQTEQPHRTPTRQEIIDAVDQRRVRKAQLIARGIDPEAEDLDFPTFYWWMTGEELEDNVVQIRPKK